MTKVQDYSSKLIGEANMKELASKLDKEIKHKGEKKLKELFLSKMNAIKTPYKVQKLAEIVYEIGQIAPAVHKSYKGMFEEVKFVLQVFSSNSIFCGKDMEDEEIQNIFKGFIMKRMGY
jgi:hypothetical protein